VKAIDVETKHVTVPKDSIGTAVMAECDAGVICPRDSTGGFFIFDRSTGETVKTFGASSMMYMSISALTCSRFTQRIFSGDENGCVTAWDKTGKKITEKAVHSHAVICLFVMNESRLVSASYHDIKISYPSTLAPIYTISFDFHAYVDVLVPLPDGKRIVYGTVFTPMEIFDVFSGSSQFCKSIFDSMRPYLQVSRCGAFWATYGSGMIRVLKLGTPMPFVVHFGEFLKHGRTMNATLLSDGTVLDETGNSVSI
jgi:WD40 repeat protein